ncbi:hypothetical protein [Lacinutrix sp. Bg11-31]|uniref:hypothetical protein n=1 Tax=Lacinutrix sp. Bg11-31 TaxID=2057808 RepID=UPI000C316CCB|nr:hypothetical protein [Lacinutrix sp. Bg11-31]AUC83183.1 hypothetical protein CW733_13995 [Lacinutrix sp. Bg11-31]
MKFKTILLPTLLSLIFLTCSKKNDDNQNNNPNIPNVGFNTGNQINMQLGGIYGQLDFDTNAIYVPNYGINGIVVINTGFNNYSAFEYSDPNHQIASCSVFELDNPGTLSAISTVATCSCNDGNSYDILSGGVPLAGTTGQYTMVRYRVEVNGSIIRVYN